MRFKKLVSMFAAAAVTVSCMAGMLMFDAGAYYVPRDPLTGAYYTNVAGEELDTFYKYLSQYSSPSTTYQIIFANGDDAIIGGPALLELKNSGKTYKFIINDGAHKYTAIFDNEFFNSLPAYPHAVYTANHGINLKLNISANSTDKRVTISGNFNSESALGQYYDSTIKYSIEYSEFASLLSSAGIPTSGQIRYYYKNESSDGSNNIVTLSITTPDSNGIFRMQNEWFSGLYITEYNVDTSDIYTKAEVEKVIEDKLKEAIGYTGDDTVPVAVQKFIADTKAQIMAQIAANYISAADASALVKNYFTPDDSADNSVKEAAKVHRSALINAILGDDENVELIRNKVFSIFGSGTTEIQARTIVDYIWDDLVKKAADNLSATSNQLNQYNTLIKYFLDNWMEDDLKDLKTIIDGLQALNIQGDVVDIINRLKDLKKSEIEDLRTLLEDYSGILQQFGLKYDSLSTFFKEFLNTESDLWNTIKEKLKVTNGTNGTDGKDGEGFEEWVKRKYPIGGLDQFIEEEILPKIGTYGYGNNVWYEYENGVKIWYTRDNYGRVVRLGSNVPNGYGYGYGSGESAYDIAVRNGYRGTEKQWLESLQGASAYEIAVNNGFRGTEREWLESLKGEDGRDGQDGQDGQDGKDGKDGRDGRDGRDGLDGQDGRVTYVYGYSGNSAAPKSTATNDTSKTSDDVVLVMDDKGGSYTTTRPASRSANPATGAAAGILIPGAAVASIVLLKKDKRKRGKRK